MCGLRVHCWGCFGHECPPRLSLILTRGQAAGRCVACTSAAGSGRGAACSTLHVMQPVIGSRLPCAGFGQMYGLRELCRVCCRL